MKTEGRTVFEVLVTDINEDIVHLKDALAGSPLRDFSEVQYLRGQISGLLSALNMVTALSKQYEED